MQDYYNWTTADEINWINELCAKGHEQTLVNYAYIVLNDLRRFDPTVDVAQVADVLRSRLAMLQRPLTAKIPAFTDETPIEEIVVL
ncbi:MAG TPA: hypothetical protein VMW24_24255 [Sedimentisphaerales bacterium]|nr:hypothetical protein [Sedimentisphaerales bacterium]